MTITYTHEVANARMGGFSNLLLRWRGSVYKLFYKEFLVYISLYSLLSVCYRHITVAEFRSYFEKLCLQFQSYTDLIPISFVLGFYVSMVVGRWWQQYMNIPWPDRLMVMITSNVHGSDYRGRLIRRTLVRYLSLAEVLTYRSMSTAVYKRFPTMKHVIDAGFMTPNEYKQYEQTKTKNVKYFIPLVWFSNLLSKVRQEGRIYDDITYLEILKVVTVAVYVFFMSTLLSRQYLDVEKKYPGHNVDLFVPIFTIFQFFFYVGWLKVAEQLINPFGEDDDDFEVNYIIDRNLEISMLTVDDMYMSHPKLERDMYWNNPNPSIPYTAASMNHKMEAFLGSTIDMSLGKDEMQFIEHLQTNHSPEPGTHLDVNNNTFNQKVMTTSGTSSTVTAPTENSMKREMKRPVNLWSLFSGRTGKESGDATKKLLDNDRNHITSSKQDIVIQIDDPPSADEYQSSETSDDSDDSDVGDGGRSEDEDTETAGNTRRSSISSIDGDEKDTKGDDSKVPQTRKHSTEEFTDERPRAKRRRSLTIDIKSGNQNEQTKRPDKLFVNVKESNYGNRSAMNKQRRSPKKKAYNPKFHKKNSLFSKPRSNADETEEERRNAQNRTYGLLKKKSIQAMQRNARRANYSGSSWIQRMRPDLDDFYRTNTDEKTDFESPFGSINSFATSVPSPRPLRFSKFSRRIKRKHFDTVSNSSCLTSPCANDDQSQPFLFPNSTQRTREESGNVNMPFTEDLRRRLLVAHAQNSTPSSSNPTSPVISRAYAIASPNSQQLQFPNNLYLDEKNSDSSSSATLTPTQKNTIWDNVHTLEAIGEVSSQSDKRPTKSEELLCQDRNENHSSTEVDSIEHVEEAISTTNEVKFKTIPQTSGPHLLRVFNSYPKLMRPESTGYKLTTKSKSCPDVSHTATTA